MFSARQRRLKELLTKPWHSQVVQQAIYKHHFPKWDHIRTLPTDVREELAQEFGDTVLKLQPVSLVHGSQVAKALLQLQGSSTQHVESVHMTYRHGGTTICISSQCGCALGCTFCATGAMGFGRNLDADEITDQVLYWLQMVCSLN